MNRRAIKTGLSTVLCLAALAVLWDGPRVSDSRVQTGHLPSTAETRGSRAARVQPVVEPDNEPKTELGVRVAHAPPPGGNSSAYDPSAVLVVGAAKTSLAALAQRHGTVVVRTGHRPTLGALAVPPNASPSAFIADLQADSAVKYAGPMGITRGAKENDSEGVPQAAADPARERRQRIREAQWFLDATEHPRWRKKFDDADTEAPADLGAWTVAVLDTGVAYEDYESYRAAPSLADSAIVAPFDAVHHDGHANDDHQHGTHIASLIAGSGDVVGMASGVSLMPIKVLDEHNSGWELDLIAGIDWAIDHGADVLNLSLSFHPDYTPSPLLMDALADARAHGIVVVAAAGNTGGDEVTWPAAAPGVIGVGSVTLAKGKSKWEVPDYANTGGGLDLLAPGGDDGDENDDDLPDGILAETIDPDDPGRIGLWMMAGTSQAAAIVSGAVVHLLDAGMPPDAVQASLQRYAHEVGGKDKWKHGYGAGIIDLEKVLKETAKHGYEEPPELHASILPFLKRKKANEVEPRVIVHVVDEHGEPVDKAEVLVSVRGLEPEIKECKTNKEGRCDVGLKKIKTDKVDATDLAWSVTVQGIVVDDYLVDPGPLLYGDEGLAAIVAATESHPELSGGLMAVYWPEGIDPELGELAAAYTVLDVAAGPSAQVGALLVAESAMHTVSDSQEFDVDLDGTGLTTSPLGFLRLRRLTLSGTGLTTSPLGLWSNLRLWALNGTGLTTSPLGFHALRLVSPRASLQGTGLTTAPLGLRTGILLRPQRFTASGLSTSPLGLKVFRGGWRTPSGAGALQGLHGSGAFSTLVSHADAWCDGESLEAVELDIDDLP